MQFVQTQLWENRQGQGLFTSGLGDGELTLFVPERAEAGLQMQRQRVVHFRTNTLFLQEVAKLVPSIGADDELVIDMKPILSLSRQAYKAALQQPGLGKHRVVGLGIVSSGFGPLVKMAQLYSQNRRLNRIQPAVDPEHIVEVFCDSAERPKRS